MPRTQPMATSKRIGLSAMRQRRGRHGLHLFDRQTGLNILLDERALPAEQWHQAPRYVSIALTNACELKCPFCYAPKTPGRLEAPTVLSWIEELDAHGCLGIGFGGGEPTAHPQLAWLCERATAHTGLAVSLTTHGHRIDQPLAARLRGNVHFLRISVDAVGERYERIRGRSFDDLKRRLHAAATISPFGLNMVVGRATIDQLDQVAAFALDSGAQELLLLPEQPVAGRPGVDDRTLEQLEAWVAQRPANIRLSISKAKIPEGIPLADPFPGELPLESHAHIDARRTVRPHAYSQEGVRVQASLMESLTTLRSLEQT